MRALCLFLLALALVRPATAQEDAPKWDVNAAHGPTETVAFTTEEGTWMNLDVSPDGQTLVFDLFGDLYTLPLGGGTATRLTSGPAFDLQPRFSPDGRHLAFTSDRAGGDNLWIMNADGTAPRQVSDESFRLVNGPAWTPDGQYLLGRKHFTSTRSLGAGEVWMYHTSGGAGLQLTKRKNDQQDQGNEIALSPDGRYVYFSEDVSGGSFFQYNKDPNTQLYAIRRLDRQTGDLDNLITGPGGAARPAPSPDGKHVAFVRRVRGKSVLYLYDLDTGAQRPLFDGLSHDQQEAWAIFGVYPGFDWTPDSRHLVFWAQGKLWRIDVATRAVSPIPFTAEVEQTVTAPLVFRNDIDDAQFQAKMLRDAVTAPDGKTLVFHAVGHLWKTTLPGGTPTRLTNATHFEYEPAFSPNGEWVVYTTWDDDALGAIYKIRLNGQERQKLTTRPGYYHEPQFSPAGQRIVYRRSSGNSLLGYIHGTERGLYWMAASGGPGTRIQKNGRTPRFGPQGDRVYFLDGGGLEKHYRSVRLDGGDERTHFDLKYANTLVPSPDFKWVAFNELHNAYIAPFPQTGGAIDLSKDTKAIPVKQISRDAGLFLHWSGDGQRVHWMLGPAYFTRSLQNSFSFVAGAPEALPAIDTTGVPITLRFDTDVPSGSVAFTGARLVTMRGNEEVIENGTLVVTGNRIVALGAAADVAIPAGAHLVDATGHTIMPGIVDAHAHAAHFFDGPSARQNWAYYANLAYGVTTSHDPSANTEFVFSQAELVRAGQIVGPRIFSTGTILYGADGDFKATVNSLDDARSHIRRMKAVGAFSVKSYNQPRREQRQQILQAAREHEMLVVPEGGSTFFHNMTMIVDGHSGIEHNVPVAPLYDDVLKVWEANPVGYTPTLVVNYGGPSGEYWWYQHTKVWDKPKLLGVYPRAALDARARRVTLVPEDEYYHITVAQSAKELVNRGVNVHLGAHGQLQGLAAHWELWMFGQGGMTNHEALEAATLSGAEYLGLDHQLGKLDAGMLADLIVIGGNPLDDLMATENVVYTMVNGRLFDTATMNEVGNHPRERTPFYWQKGGLNDTFIWSDDETGFGLPHAPEGH